MGKPKGINTKAFGVNNIMASVNASSNAYMRKNHQLSDIAQIFEDLKKDFANCYVPNNKQREILEEAAKIGVIMAQQEAPKADDVVKIYNTAKISKKLRAPKGKGTVKKVIRPGNLAKFIRIYTHGRFKKINSAVFYGPKYPQVAYAHLLEFGSKFMKQTYPFMGPAYEKAKAPMLALIKGRYKSELIKVWNASVNKNK